MRRHGLRSLALSLLGPCLVGSAILNQQTSAGLLLMGQVFSTLGTAASLVVVLATFPRHRGVVGMIGLVVGLRLMRIFLPDQGTLLLAYTVLSSSVYLVAGAVAAVVAPRLVARQFFWICAICLPLMVIQVLGVAEWSQMLRTDLHDGGLGIRDQYPTLFRVTGEVVLNVIQSRPAGLFPSNNLLSMVLLFTIGWHFAITARRGSLWRDAVLMAVAVLSMAKIVFLGLSLILGWILVAGGRGRRWRAVRAVVMTAVLLIAYIDLFPGLFDYNLDWEKTVLNFQLRLNDFLYASGFVAAQDYALRNLQDVTAQQSIFNEGQRESGYATIAWALPAIIGAALLLLIPYVGGIRGLRRYARPLVLLATTSALVTVLVPAITSFLSAVMFWFLAGPAVIPLAAATMRGFRSLIMEQSERLNTLTAAR